MTKGERYSLVGNSACESTFRIITPTFLTGTDQTKVEMRATTLKGLLRYWYRALDSKTT
ncbi:type III-B CRISPR module RAMP protein Cmr1 [Laceyella tengchongensis]|uniref:type III-B CRISPR module RAMP protein Cmr1 n=1 Tax=Laceyella tengchongensis TaxID=574699 RepID=UPI003D6CEA0A